jgi:hypothetical protein
MTTDTRKREDANHDREFNIGDLVNINGYPREIFRIDGYVHSHHVYDGEAWDELAYELTRVDTGDWLDADEDDMILVCKAEKADAYIRKMTRKRKAKNVRNGGRDSVYQRKDALLTKLADLMTLRDTFGDDEENDYIAKIKRIKTQLARMTK